MTFYRNKKDFPWTMPLLLAVALVIGVFLGFILSNKNDNPLFAKYEGGVSARGGEIEEILQWVESRYYKNIHPDTLRQAAIDAIFQRLDPFSQYISASENKNIMEQMNGQFEGIGIEYSVYEEKIAVLRVVPDGPAAMSGLRPGDFIIGVDGHQPKSEPGSSQQIIQRIKGAANTSCRLIIDRHGKDAPIEIDVLRQEVKIHPVGAAFMLNDTVGYIQLKRFNASAYKGFMEAVESLVEEQKMQDLVIDLRGNPGGFLQEAVNMLSQFFREKGKLLVFTKGVHQNKVEYTSTGKSFFPIRRIAVLIDEQSASASEIVAGVIQDLDRGIVVGAPSFGKGLVQEHFNLRSGAAIRLSVANYYMPSGRSIQKKSDSSEKPDSADMYKTSRGRPVYGNWGIQPDISVRSELTDAQIKMQNNWLQLTADYSFYKLREWFDQKEIIIPLLKKKEEALMAELITELISYIQKQEGEKEVTIEQSTLPLSFLQERLLYLLMDEKAYFTWLTEKDEATSLAIKNLHNASILKQKEAGSN